MNRILFPADQVADLVELAGETSGPEGAGDGELRVIGSGKEGIMLLAQAGGEMARVYARGCKPMQRGEGSAYCEQLLNGKSIDLVLPWECVSDQAEEEGGYWELVMDKGGEAVLLHVSEKEYAAHRTFCIGQNLLHLVVVESL